MKTIMKNAPLLLLTIGSVFLMTMIAIGERDTIYRDQEHDFLEEPMLTLVFQGANEGKYPWQIFSGDAPAKEKELQVLSQNAVAETNLAGPESVDGSQPQATATPSEQPLPADDPAMSSAAGPDGQPIPDVEEEVTWEWTDAGSEKGFPDEYGEIQPFRESTYEEYLNHISADIYGTVGVERAAEYGFAPVEEDYFNDALFIGDSRTVGLRDYTSLSEHADFLCANSLSIFKVWNRNIGKGGKVEDALSDNVYGKIYLSSGINELGRGTTEDFIGEYKEVVGKLREMEPEAIIIVQAIMKVSAAQNEKDSIFNNYNIEARNRAIASLADNRHIFYVDVNEAICDEDGNLDERYTYDEIHLLGLYNENVKQFLMDHGVLINFE